MVDVGCDHSAVCDKMVRVDPTTTVAAFVGFFVCAGEAAGCSRSLHDVGPGSTVPEEQLSHGRDSANVSGHAIPAVPHGKQCAALFDTEPAENEILD